MLGSRRGAARGGAGSTRQDPATSAPHAGTESPAPTVVAHIVPEGRAADHGPTVTRYRGARGIRLAAHWQPVPSKCRSYVPGARANSGVSPLASGATVSSSSTANSVASGCSPMRPIQARAWQVVAGAGTSTHQATAPCSGLTSIGWTSSVGAGRVVCPTRTLVHCRSRRRGPLPTRAEEPEGGSLRALGSLIDHARQEHRLPQMGLPPPGRAPVRGDRARRGRLRWPPARRPIGRRVDVVHENFISAWVRCHHPVGAIRHSGPR